MYCPNYTVTAHLLELIERIASLKTRIELSPVSVSWIPLLTKEAFSRLAHSSTAIEGNPLTLNEVELLASGQPLPQVPRRYTREVLNYLAALRFISERKDKKILTIEDVLHLHEIVGKEAFEKDIAVGALRTFQVYVGNHKPPKYSAVRGMMDDLIRWLNKQGQKLPAVLSSGILHYQFEYIHPFGDGNGRVGRLLATWELYRRSFDTFHIFSVDEVFWENRQRYYAALERVRMVDGDLTGWLEFIAEAVDLTLERTWMRIQMVSKAHGKTKLQLLPKQEKLLVLLRNGSMGIQEIEDALGVTKAGAHFLIRPLKEGGLIKREGGHKTGKYALS